MVTGVATYQVEGEAMEWEKGLDKMTASNVDALGTGPEIVLWQVVVVVVVGAHFLHVPGLAVLVDMGIALMVTVTATLMTAMMEDAMEIGIDLIAVTTNMAAVIAILVTGT